MWPRRVSVNWTGNDNTFFFFFPVLNKVWHQIMRLISLFGTQQSLRSIHTKKVKSKSVLNELDFVGPNVLGPVLGCIRFHKCFGSKWYVIWNKSFGLQKVLPFPIRKNKVELEKLPLPFCPWSLIRSKSLLSMRCDYRVEPVQRSSLWPCVGSIVIIPWVTGRGM